MRAVLGELAVAAFELERDDVDLELLVVDTGGAADVTTSALAAATELGIKAELIESRGGRAWSVQRDAFEHALRDDRSDFVVTLDAAGHHDARQLPDLVRAFRSRGSGVTIGSRWIRGGTAPGTALPRAVLSRAASLAVARAAGLRRIRDTTTSFRVIRPDAAALVAADPATRSDYGFYCEFVAAAQAYGFTVDEVPITFRPRFGDVPRLRLGDLTEFLADVRRIRRRVAAIRSEMADDQTTWAGRSGRLRNQAPVVGSEFGALHELTELSGANRFGAWIVETFRPIVGASVLDVGAGLGSIAELLAAEPGERRVTAIEPAENVFPELARRLAGTGVEVRQLTSAELAAERPAEFDTVLYVSVLEHIEDHAGELATAYRLVAPGGHVGIFVPAMPSLYGQLDYKSGHYRRYTAGDLAERLRDAGFVDVDVRYFDLVGVAPYWVMYRLLDVSRLDRVSLTGYDRVVVPISRLVQRLVPRPWRGKNLVATARRPEV